VGGQRDQGKRGHIGWMKIPTMMMRTSKLPKTSQTRSLVTGALVTHYVFTRYLVSLGARAQGGRAGRGAWDSGDGLIGPSP
jgi:hypothetical protein